MTAEEYLSAIDPGTGLTMRELTFAFMSPKHAKAEIQAVYDFFDGGKHKQKYKPVVKWIERGGQK